MGFLFGGLPVDTLYPFALVVPRGLPTFRFTDVKVKFFNLVLVILISFYTKWHIVDPYLVYLL
jgi:hypothetical protein